MGVVKNMVKGVLGMDNSAQKAAEEAARGQEENMRRQTQQAESQAMLESANALSKVANVQAGGQEAADIYDPKKKKSGSNDTLGIGVL